MLWITKLVNVVYDFYNICKHSVLIEKVPPDTEFEFCRVDRVSVCREVIPASEELVKVLVFYKQVRTFNIQRDEHVHFGVITCFFDFLVIELYDSRVVRICVERCIVKYVDTNLET